MTELLDNAVEATRKAPPETQDAVARFMLDMIHSEPAEIPAEHIEAIFDGEAQADRGEFATDKQVAEAFRRFAR